MRWVCGECGADVPTGEVTCPTCGAENVRRAGRTVWRCRDCGQDNRDPDTECWNCGETDFERVDPDPDPDPAADGRAGVVTAPTAASADLGTGGQAPAGQATGEESTIGSRLGLDDRRSVAMVGVVGLVALALVAVFAAGGLPGARGDFVGYNETASGIELGTVEYEVYRQVATDLSGGSAIGRSVELSEIVAASQYRAESKHNNRPSDMQKAIRHGVRTGDVGCPDPLVYATKLTASEGRAIDQIESEGHLAVALADRLLESEFAQTLREEGGRTEFGLDVFVASDGDIHFGAVAC